MTSISVQLKIDEDLKTLHDDLAAPEIKAVEALSALNRAAVDNGTAEMTLDEINAEIEAVRKAGRVKA